MTKSRTPSPPGEGRGEGVTLRRSILSSLALFLCLACASHRSGPLPTLEDYSDGASTFAEAFLEDWKAGAADPALYSRDFAWHGPLPGDALAPVPSRPPLAVSVY